MTLVLIIVVSPAMNNVAITSIPITRQSRVSRSESIDCCARWERHSLRSALVGSVGTGTWRVQAWR